MLRKNYTNYDKLLGLGEKLTLSIGTQNMLSLVSVVMIIRALLNEQNPHETKENSKV